MASGLFDSSTASGNTVMGNNITEGIYVERHASHNNIHGAHTCTPLCSSADFKLLPQTTLANVFV
jgi:hypothetical protein